MIASSNILNQIGPRKNLITGILFFFGVVTFSVVLSSCGGTKSIESTASTQPSGWYKVVQIEQTPIFEGHPTLNFDLTQNRISGNTGCNDYSGTMVQPEANSNNFTLESIMTTKMYCSDPVMAIEFKFLKILGQPMGWQHKGDTLSLYTDGPQAAIIAVKKPGQ